MPNQPLIARTEPWGAIRQALASAQKSNRNAPAYSRWFNRPLGRIFAATGYKFGLTPNQITIMSAVFTFTGIIVLAFATPSWPLGFLIAFLLVMGYALDSADGQVARLQGGGSAAGEWLDHVIDSVKMGSIHLAVAVMWYRNLDAWPLWTVLIPLVFQVQSVANFSGIILTDLVMRAMGAKKPVLAKDEERPSIIMSLLGIPADYGFFSFTFVLLGWFSGWRLLYVVLTVLNVLLLMVLMVRWYRRVAAAKPADAV